MTRLYLLPDHLMALQTPGVFPKYELVENFCGLTRQEYLEIKNITLNLDNGYFVTIDEEKGYELRRDSQVRAVYHSDHVKLLGTDQLFTYFVTNCKVYGGMDVRDLCI